LGGGKRRFIGVVREGLEVWRDESWFHIRETKKGGGKERLGCKNEVHKRRKKLLKEETKPKAGD